MGYGWRGLRRWGRGRGREGAREKGGKRRAGNGRRAGGRRGGEMQEGWGREAVVELEGLIVLRTWVFHCERSFPGKAGCFQERGFGASRRRS